MQPKLGIDVKFVILGFRKCLNTSEQVDVGANDRLEGVVAHFVAHNKAVVALEFDANGSLLLTCDKMGSYFNLFKIVPHPAGSSYSAVHHLYSLYRGDTPGSVQVKQAYFLSTFGQQQAYFFAQCFEFMRQIP